MNRRSFLGLLAGAVLVKPVAKIGPVGLVSPIQTATTLDWWMPFTISDWANLQPGEIADAVLFGGEQPKEFLLKSVAIHVASSALVKDVRAIHGETVLSGTDDEYVRDGAWLEVKTGDLMLFETPLWYLAGMDSLQLPFAFRSIQPLSARIRSSGPLQISKPTMIFMAMQGEVRMNAEQVERLRAAWEAEESSAVSAPEPNPSTVL